VFLKASIEVDGITVPVTLKNLSEQGALVEGPTLPQEGSQTRFHRNELGVAGDVVWVEGRFAGIRFHHPLNRDELLRNVPAPKPRAEMNFKRPGLACRPLSHHERAMLEQWMTYAPVGRPGE
jgi:hypothetical protein